MGVALRRANSSKAQIFFRQVQDFARLLSRRPASVLAYVIAHEIGHLLLPGNAHSPTGVMQADWDKALVHNAATRFADVYRGASGPDTGVSLTVSAAPLPRSARSAAQLSPTMALQTGDRLGAYEIVGLLGHGAMGEVYRARDTRLGRDVAVKVLPAAFATRCRPSRAP